MLFQLPSFLLFFLIFCALFAFCPRKFLLNYVTIASLVFYAWWYPPAVLLLIALIVGCWLMLQLVWRDRRWLALCVVLSLMPLVLFKYTDFLLETIDGILGIESPRLGWALPLGLSFVTFTIISYLVDTARQPSQKRPGFWPTAVYLTFFPHLIAGPILRANHILPQLPRLAIAWADFMPNLALFTVGMLKKVLVADPVGAYVDQAYSSHATLSGWESVAAIFGFSIQIYCDFSAYSDMAIALAGMLGISFPENFRSPYISTSLGEVWRRWHITLSFWLRDYVFKPLHGRLHKYARHLSIVLTMIVSGLWHGAAWTFIVWGLAQGLIMVVESISGYRRFSATSSGWQRGFCILLTFLVWSVLTVIFRSPSMSVAYDVAIGSFVRVGLGDWPAAATVPVLLGVGLLLLHPFDQVDKIRAAAARVPTAILAPMCLLLCLGCATIASMQPANFYYFDF
ncbi:MBOAT family O-acyltransferase [Orrella marina]|uniref:Probable alginate O-acetylase AlgI n=1 Tax=Orrella marina TaxID=2163011 RepID=A0A2R4XH68_9BURK|nr:MBOAT family O-acyltransferase [Orrella marina]AWB33059.1 MBOAT family protein [Orrella marina]